MALDLGDLQATVGVDPADFLRGLQRAERAFDQTAGELVDTADAASEAVDQALAVDGREMQQSLDEQRTRMQRWGDRMATAGAAIGAAIGVALSAALVEAIQLDDAQAMMAAQMGDTTWARELGAVAGHMYTAGWGESVQDNMAAIRAVMASGLLDEDAATADIEAVSIKARALADVFGEDVTATARAAGQMIRNGLARDADEAFDILTRGFQQTADLAGDMMDTWSEYSTQFRKLGLSGVQAMGLMTQGVRAGARDLDTVADGLKEFAIISASGSKAAAGGFRALGLNAKQMTAIFAKGGPEAAAALDVVLDRIRAMKDPTEREAAAVALFGTKAEDLQGALGALDLSSATDEMGKVAGAAQEMTDAVGDSAGAQLESFKRQVQEALVHQVAKALPVLRGLLTWAQENKTWLQPVVYILGGIAAALMLVSIGAKVATAATTAWAVVTKVATAAQWLWNAALMANPIGLLIAAILLIVAGLAILYFKVDWVRNAIDGFFRFVVDAALLWWRVFSGFWTTVGTFFVDLFRGWWELFTGFWSGVFNAVVGYVGWVIGRWEALIGFITSVPGRIGRAASGMWDGIKNAFRSAINWIIGRWNGLALRLPAISIPGIGQVWGGMTLSTPDLPMLDTGGRILRTGLAVVHTGERVIPAAQARREQPSPPGDAARSGTLRVVIDTTGVITGLRREISYQGGDVQTVLGGAP